MLYCLHVCFQGRFRLAIADGLLLQMQKNLISACPELIDFDDMREATVPALP